MFLILYAFRIEIFYFGGKFLNHHFRKEPSLSLTYRLITLYKIVYLKNSKPR